MRTELYIGLGSNLGDRWANLRHGIRGLVERGLMPLDLSSVWETDPIDVPGSGRFLNMVVRSETVLEPREVLETLLGIERENGRVRGPGNASRTLDLDLLLMGDVEIDEPDLRVPHPRMWVRRFVLEPLAELAPDLRNPATGRSAAEECRRIGSDQHARRLGELAPRSSHPL
jgi:2-amino-4-hydroxy-6-hydroxymethyldihydropteridine diphosphokinase